MRPKDLVLPDWPAPGNVRAFTTTRSGGVSAGPWASLNLGLNCGDEQDHVLANRKLLAESLPAQPLWMRQVHGSRVLGPEDGSELVEADARVTSRPGEVLAVLTADCLPVFLCDDRGEAVGIAHAGWRGLSSGVIEATVKRIGVQPQRLLAWLGPAVSGEVYEVGGEVREAFARSPALARECVDAAFSKSGDRWRLDITRAARVILAGLGVAQVFGAGFCTWRDPERFFSHRRDGITGRMASVIWLEQI